jgi:hypothetical protein
MFGAPPGPGASRAESLRYIRRIVLRYTIGIVVLSSAGFVLESAYWGSVKPGVVVLLGVIGVALLNRDIRRAEHGSDSGSPFGR